MQLKDILKTIDGKIGQFIQGAWKKPEIVDKLRHLAYAGGWKKFEPLWDIAIKLKRVTNFLPLLEGVLDVTGRSTRTDLLVNGRKESGVILKAGKLARAKTIEDIRCREI